MLASKPSLSVVLPHYRNERTLAACLQSFAAQKHAGVAEIIVVDDSGIPSADPIVHATRWEVPVSVLHTDRAGQSAATNAGIRAAAHPLVLLTCADIIASPHLVHSHLCVHAQSPKPRAVMGPIVYAPWILMTPIMRFLSAPGVQFDFRGLDDGDAVDPAKLYAPNVSVPKGALIRAGLFAEDLPYGFQDTDLGLRLGQHQVSLTFCRDAEVLHDHPSSVRSYAQRQNTVFRFFAAMARRYPNRDPGEKLLQVLGHYAPRRHELERVIRTAERANAAAGTRPLDAHSEATLMRLFDTLGAMAMVQGILRDPMGLTLWLQEQHHEALLAQLRACQALPTGQH